MPMPGMSASTKIWPLRPERLPGKACFWRLTLGRCWTNSLHKSHPPFPFPKSRKARSRQGDSIYWFHPSTGAPLASPHQGWVSSLDPEKGNAAALLIQVKGLDAGLAVNGKERLLPLCFELFLMHPGTSCGCSQKVQKNLLALIKQLPYNMLVYFETTPRFHLAPK